MRGDFAPWKCKIPTEVATLPFKNNREIESNRGKVNKIDVLKELEKIIQQRYQSWKNNSKSLAQKSYTVSLFEQGLNKIAQKVGEEGVEVALAAVAEADEAVLNESADLLYHLLVVLRVRGISLQHVYSILRSRMTES